MKPMKMRKLIWRQFLRHRLAVYSSVVLLLLVLSAVFAPLLAPHDPSYIDPPAFDQGRLRRSIRWAPTASGETYLAG